MTNDLADYKRMAEEYRRQLGVINLKIEAKEKILRHDMMSQERIREARSVEILRGMREDVKFGLIGIYMQIRKMEEADEAKRNHQRDCERDDFGDDEARDRQVVGAGQL